MKYLVELEVPATMGEEMHRRGGPGAVPRPILERFKPECVYGMLGVRGVVFVAEPADPVAINALMEMTTEDLGCYPRLRPVIDGRDLPAHVKAVHAWIEEGAK